MAQDVSLIESTSRQKVTFKILGVEYPINPGNSTSFQLKRQKLLVSIQAASIKKSLSQCKVLDHLLASEIRRCSKYMKFSQTEKLFQPANAEGRGYQRI